MKKMDEMELYITSKSMKIAYAYTTIFLIIWSIYNYFKYSEAGLPLLLFITQSVVINVSSLILKKKMGGKSEE
ncbi:hypothetical protein [Clostridium oceanicum]|uniref:Group-specific protein n=1 Tax=Clostridium oceanicum TaxID=1543 RepID=A0ABN1JBM4_9CLOT